MVTHMCVCVRRNYEKLFNAELPDYERGKQRRRQITDTLIIRKASVESHGSCGGGQPVELVPQPMTNPMTTLPVAQAGSSESGPNHSPDISEWKPSGTLFAGAAAYPARKIPSQTGEMQEAGGFQGDTSPKIDLKSVRMRQIELQERKNHGESFEERKSPWRPPGKNGGSKKVERRQRKAWTPAIFTSISSSEITSQVRDMYPWHRIRVTVDNSRDCFCRNQLHRQAWGILSIPQFWGTICPHLLIKSIYLTFLCLE